MNKYTCNYMYKFTCIFFYTSWPKQIFWW